MRFLSACLVTALFAAANASAADLTATVRKPEVNVYAAPNLESAKLKKLKQDDAVGIASQQGLWYELKLPDGTNGFVRVNDVRVNYGGAEDSDANIRVLTTGKAGVGRVSETAGVRGIDESELKAASFNQAQFDAMVANRADAAASAAYASGHGWQATAVAWDAESKPKKDDKASTVLVVRLVHAARPERHDGLARPEGEFDARHGEQGGAEVRAGAGRGGTRARPADRRPRARRAPAVGRRRSAEARQRRRPLGRLADEPAGTAVDLRRDRRRGGQCLRGARRLRARDPRAVRAAVLRRGARGRARRTRSATPSSATTTT